MGKVFYRGIVVTCELTGTYDTCNPTCIHTDEYNPYRFTVEFQGQPDLVIETSFINTFLTRTELHLAQI